MTVRPTRAGRRCHPDKRLSSFICTPHTCRAGIIYEFVNSDIAKTNGGDRRSVECHSTESATRRNDADSILARLKRDNPDLAGRVWRDEVPVARRNGTNQHSSPSGSSGTQPTSATRRNDADSILARLKRDNPELAQQVINGEITANAAARIMGWRYWRFLQY